MKKSGKSMAVIMALLAATFYAINTPFSKILLEKVTPTFMASFLYLGAGIGVGIMYLLNSKKRRKLKSCQKQIYHILSE